MVGMMEAIAASKIPLAAGTVVPSAGAKSGATPPQHGFAQVLEAVQSGSPQEAKVGLPKEPAADSPKGPKAGVSPADGAPREAEARSADKASPVQAGKHEKAAKTKAQKKKTEETPGTALLALWSAQGLAVTETVSSRQLKVEAGGVAEKEQGGPVAGVESAAGGDPQAVLASDQSRKPAAGPAAAGPTAAGSAAAGSAGDLPLPAIAPADLAAIAPSLLPEGGTEVGKKNTVAAPDPRQGKERTLMVDVPEVADKHVPEPAGPTGKRTPAVIESAEKHAAESPDQGALPQLVPLPESVPIKQAKEQPIPEAVQSKPSQGKTVPSEVRPPEVRPSEVRQPEARQPEAGPSVPAHSGQPDAANVIRVEASAGREDAMRNPVTPLPPHQQVQVRTKTSERSQAAESGSPEKASPAPAAHKLTSAETNPEKPVVEDPPKAASGVAVEQLAVAAGGAGNRGAHDVAASAAAVIEPGQAGREQEISTGRPAEPSGGKSTPASVADSSFATASPNPAEGASRLQAVHWLERMGHTEMHLGVRTPELGLVEVRTVVREAQVSAAVGVERTEMRPVMAAELSGLGERLARHQLQLDEVVVRGGGLASDAGTGSGRQHPSPSWQEPADTSLMAEASVSGYESAASAGETMAWPQPRGLSIHV